MSYGTRRRSTRHEMTIGDKREIIRLIDIRASQNDIAKIYNCSQSQISRMASKRDDIIADYENCDDPQQKKCRYDTASLYVKMGQNAPNPAVMNQSTSPHTSAEHLDSSHDTNSEQSMTAEHSNSSWLEYWKNHSSRQTLKIEDMDAFRYGVQRGSTASSRGRPKGNMNKESRISNHLLDILKCYDLCDIYCADELALYYNAMPSFDSSDNEDEGEREKANGVANPEVKQITVLLTCNVTGSDKRDFVVIENSRQVELPGPLAGCHRAKAPHAWMTSDVYKEYLLALDYDMRRQNRYILLFVDNAPPHIPEAGKSLEHIRVVYLRSYCTPFFHGIFYCVRTHYRKQMLLKVLAHSPDVLNANGGARRMQEKTAKSIKVNFEEAIAMLKKAWQAVPTQEVVQCFSKSGLCAPHIHGLESDSEESDLPELPNGFITDEQFENFVNVDVDAECAGDASLLSAECRILSDLRGQGFTDVGMEPNKDFSNLNISGSSDNSAQLGPTNHHISPGSSLTVKQEIITVSLPTPTLAKPKDCVAPSARSCTTTASHMNNASKFGAGNVSSSQVKVGLDTIRNYLEQCGLHLHNLHALEAQIASHMPDSNSK